MPFPVLFLVEAGVPGHVSQPDKRELCDPHVCFLALRYMERTCFGFLRECAAKVCPHISLASQMFHEFAVPTNAFNKRRLHF